MSVKYERRMAITEMRMLEHRRNEEILEEAKVEQIATVMRRSGLATSKEEMKPRTSEQLSK